MQQLVHKTITGIILASFATLNKNISDLLMDKLSFLNLSKEEFGAFASQLPWVLVFGYALYWLVVLVKDPIFQRYKKWRERINLNVEFNFPIRFTYKKPTVSEKLTSISQSDNSGLSEKEKRLLILVEKSNKQHVRMDRLSLKRAIANILDLSEPLTELLFMKSTQKNLIFFTQGVAYANSTYLMLIREDEFENIWQNLPTDLRQYDRSVIPF